MVADPAARRQRAGLRPLRVEEPREPRHLVGIVEGDGVVPGGADQPLVDRVVGAGAAIAQQSEVAVPELEVQQIGLAGTEPQRAGAEEAARVGCGGPAA